MAFNKIKIVHIITGLNVGGAEMMLFKLLLRLDPSKFDTIVISLMGKGPVGIMIQNLGINVFYMDLSPKRPDPIKILKTLNIIKKFSPTIVQTWLYHGDLFGSLIAKITGNAKLLWNIRHSDFDPSREKKITLLIVKCCSMLSHFFPIYIICNSQSGTNVHKKIGYAKDKFKVIGNGFDTELFKPCEQSYRELRQQLKIPQNSRIIGFVARFHHQKNHFGFFQAAKIIHNSIPNAHFVLCGENIQKSNNCLNRMLNRLGDVSYIHLLGIQKDMASITAGFDIAISNSTVGEGFPNVIGEAMACGVPCVATDVGDSSYLIADTGITIPPNNPKILAKACIELLTMKRAPFQELGRKAKLRIRQHFGIKKIAKEYEQLYLSVVGY